MNTLPQVFNFHNKTVRAMLDEQGKPLFVATDVAKALGYSDTVNAIKQHCKGVVKHHPIQDRLNREQNVRVIYEPDVYRLIFGSKLKNAIEFQNWVFEDVLPSIRKTGSYGNNADTVALTYIAIWADKLIGNTNTKTIETVKQKIGVEDLSQLDEIQILDGIKIALDTVEADIKTKVKPKIELQQINSVINMPDNTHNLRIALHSVIGIVASCYIDSRTAHGVIDSRLAHACKLANLQWITHDRLSTALRELADITDEAVKHRDTLHQIDKNAITCMRLINNNNALGYIG